jgi:OOP family OmpA-OmpF porin
VNGLTKFIIGGVATSLMAMASHSLFGMGNGFIDGLEAKASAAVTSAGAPAGVTLAFEREPALRRIAILSGPADDATKARLLAAVRAIPGVADARWADDGAAAPVAQEAPATAQAVADCQSKVDAAINGKTIEFALGSASITAGSTPLIDGVAEALGPCAGVTVEVAGHTDASGAAAANQTLSQNRAEAVVAALVAKGVPAARLVAHGYGSTQPRVQGRGATADAANRRIEFKIASNTPAAAPAAATPGEGQ